MGIDYLDGDVAYLLGMITARGKIMESSGPTTISIEFPFVNQYAEGVNIDRPQRESIIVSMYRVMMRISELSEAPWEMQEQENAVVLVLRFRKNTMFLRNIRMLMNYKTAYQDFLIPDPIFEAGVPIQKEFIRGFADVAGSARASNYDISEKKFRRIYLDVLFSQNWLLPVQICYLLQNHLDVPVATITWGHPNIRDPNLKKFNNGAKHFWAKEHQIKIYAEDFEKIGFYMSHKDEILKDLAEDNTKKRRRKSSFCDPWMKTKVSKCPKHPAEDSERIPEMIRGEHYDSYRGICLKLGCPRYREYMRDQTTLV